jgi:hypothetical protein
MIQFKPIDAEGIQDRAYRIYYNEGQNRTDRFSQVASCWAKLLLLEASEPRLCTCHSVQNQNAFLGTCAVAALDPCPLAVRASAAYAFCLRLGRGCIVAGRQHRSSGRVFCTVRV